MEPALGFEPRTDGLQNRSSTAELSRQVVWNRRDLRPRGRDGPACVAPRLWPSVLLPNNK